MSSLIYSLVIAIVALVPVTVNQFVEDSESASPTMFLEQTDQEFFYDVSPRYMQTRTKTEMEQARSMAEFDSPEKIARIVSYKSVIVSTFDDNYEPIIEVAGETSEFNEAQLKLLQSVDYSDDVLIRTEYLIKKNGKVEDGYTTPHITIVPEKQAEYAGGNKALVEYLKSNSIEQITIVKKDKLKPGKVRFTISEDGTISKAILVSTSGYPSIDKHMTKLITEAPGKWEAATDGNGNQVEEQLVFSFGIVGC